VFVSSAEWGTATRTDSISVKITIPGSGSSNDSTRGVRLEIRTPYGVPAIHDCDTRIAPTTAVWASKIRMNL
jgi:hypothetical protein